MSLRYTVAGGSWTNPNTWDGGTLPDLETDDVEVRHFVTAATLLIRRSLVIVGSGVLAAESLSVAAGGTVTVAAEATLNTFEADIGAGATATVAGDWNIQIGDHAVGGRLYVTGRLLVTDGVALVVSGSALFGGSAQVQLAESGAAVRVASGGLLDVAMTITGWQVAEGAYVAACGSASLIRVFGDFPLTAAAFGYWGGAMQLVGWRARVYVPRASGGPLFLCEASMPQTVRRIGV